MSEEKSRYEVSDVVLDTAKQLTRGDRNASYGEPNQDFMKTAAMWSGYLKFKLQEGIVLQPKDVAAMMIMLKLSRAEHAAKLDNWVDAAGYAACGWRCEEGKKEEGSKPKKTGVKFFCRYCGSYPDADRISEDGRHQICGERLSIVE
jgi:hypothetical protein